MKKMLDWNGRSGWVAIVQTESSLQVEPETVKFYFFLTVYWPDSTSITNQGARRALSAEKECYFSLHTYAFLFREVTTSCLFFPLHLSLNWKGFKVALYWSSVPLQVCFGTGVAATVTVLLSAQN